MLMLLQTTSWEETQDTAYNVIHLLICSVFRSRSYHAGHTSWGCSQIFPSVSMPSQGWIRRQPSEDSGRGKRRIQALWRPSEAPHPAGKPMPGLIGDRRDLAIDCARGRGNL